MTEEFVALKIRLHDVTAGYLIGARGGQNALIFSEDFHQNPDRPTFTLSTNPRHPSAHEIMEKPWARRQRLHPVLSNLLPEGSLRELIAHSLKVPVDNEFHIFAELGMDLPGAIVAESVDPDDLPDYVARIIPGGRTVKIASAQREDSRFSLAGVQMKFSMKAGQDGRYNLSKGGVLGDWIVKTPSTKHAEVPVNEFTAMSLASMIGVDIPEIQLIALEKLDNLPPINLPNEKLAFAIRRFDRNGDVRVHMEDFGQVLFKYPLEKYDSANNEQIGRILYEYSGGALQDVQQQVRRLLANILLANGDAHIKNWSLLYADQVTPRLSPAYDIMTTSVYMRDERKFTLNLAGNKDWYAASYEHFDGWAKKVRAPWRAIKPHLDDSMDKARTLWPSALNDLPMNDEHKTKLREHWKRLHGDFRI